MFRTFEDTLTSFADIAETFGDVRLDSIDDTAQRLVEWTDDESFDIDPDWRDFPLPTAELRRLTRQMRASRRCQMRPSLRVPDWGPSFEPDEGRGCTTPMSDDVYTDSIVPYGDVLAFGGAL